MKRCIFLAMEIRLTLPPIIMVQWRMGPSSKILASFRLGWFSTSMIMGKRVPSRMPTSLFLFPPLSMVAHKSTENSILFDNKSVIDRRLLKIWGDGAVIPICSVYVIFTYRFTQKFKAFMYIGLDSSPIRSLIWEIPVGEWVDTQNPPRWGHLRRRREN